jgi:hypothetical protein
MVVFIIGILSSFCLLSCAVALRFSISATNLYISSSISALTSSAVYSVGIPFNQPPKVCTTGRPLSFIYGVSSSLKRAKEMRSLLISMFFAFILLPLLDMFVRCARQSIN